MKNNNFKIDDKVRLLDGRIGLIIEQNQDNPCYYKVETYDGDGKNTYFKVFYKDMQKIS